MPCTYFVYNTPTVVGFLYRGPRTAKRMGGIKDWHLISIVASFILVDIFILSMYTALEGILTHFSAGRTPNEEKLSKVDEVGMASSDSVTQLGKTLRKYMYIDCGT